MCQFGTQKFDFEEGNYHKIAVFYVIQFNLLLVFKILGSFPSKTLQPSSKSITAPLVFA